MIRWCSVLGVAVLAVACSQSDPGITTSVKTKLASDDLVKARNINVDTTDRVVRLSGTVESSAEEARALDIARGTDGVNQVVDAIEIVPEAAEPDRSVGDQLSEPLQGDAALTAKVKTKFLADATVKGLEIDVDSNNTVVTLNGSVGTEAEHARAIQLARETDGVTQVVDRLTVRK